MEYTEDTGLQYVKDVLLKNGFSKMSDNEFMKGLGVIVTIEEDHYKVSNYDPGFLEWMEWSSSDLLIYSLLGYLSYYEFIERGYKL